MSNNGIKSSKTLGTNFSGKNCNMFGTSWQRQHSKGSANSENADGNNISVNNN